MGQHILLCLLTLLVVVHVSYGILLTEEFSYNIEQTVNDVVVTNVSLPVCVPVLSNDQSGTTILSFTNGSIGYTYQNFPPFYLPNSTGIIVFEAENYHIANYRNLSDPDYYDFPLISWQNGSSGLSSGGVYVAPVPDTGSNTGNNQYGVAIGFNLAFQFTGTYKVYLRGLGPTTNSDSAHILFQDDLASPVKFLSYGTSPFTLPAFGGWAQSSVSITVTKAWPNIARFYLAMREDGVEADQLFITPTAYSLGSTMQQNSQMCSCASNEILYFPASGFAGVDTFTYQGTNGTSTSTGTVSVYIGVPPPSPSMTPSRTPTPSRTASPSTSASRTPSMSPTPSATPSRTPSTTPSPSINSSPSTTPSITPSPSPTSSVTPTASMTPTASPSTSVSPSISPTASMTPTPTSTPSNSPTPSPLPPMCDGSSSSSSSFHILTPFNSSANFGQTFKPFASGELQSISFVRSSTDTGVLNGTAYLMLGVATDPDSGVSLRSFPFSMNGPGIQTFTFNPPVRVDATRYVFLLDTLEGDSPASMLLSDVPLTAQYSVMDSEIDPDHTAVFQYCMVPDYVPSPSITPSTTPSITPTSSVVPPSPSPAESDSTKKKSNTAAIAGAAAGGGACLLIAGAVAIVFIRKRKQGGAGSDSKADIELSSPPRKQEIPYQPIGGLTPPSGTGHYSGIPVEAEWNIEYKDLELTKEIGRGAFGIVYQGRWKNTSVAVKQVLFDSTSSTKYTLQDFFGEAEVMKKLKPHPNVTRLLGLCSNPVCIVLEFVDNGSLWSWLEAEKSLGSKTQIAIARGIAEGMLYLHNEGIIHRDLAARNILLDSNMCPKVSDFGMSRQVLENKTNKTTSEIGPIRWMAPEAMRQRVYNKKTDSWSYGAVLYEILTRTMPYHQYDLVHVATSVSLKELSLVPEIKKDAEEKKYPQVIVRLLEVCQSFEPENRPDFEAIIKMFDDDLNNNNA